MCPPASDLHADDHYDVLGLTKEATDKEITAAYKRLALKYHPDKNPSDRQQAELSFKRISLAYSTLCDTSRKQSCNSSTESTPPGASNLGTPERAEELYHRFFGNTCGAQRSNINDINIAGIFDFNTKTSKEHKMPNKLDSTSLVPVGTSVIVHGLSGSSEHNGKSASVQAWNAEKRRYQVLLNSGTILSLRPQNIRQLCHVRVIGHENLPEVNGRCAEIVDFNAESGCYVLLLDDPALVIELPPQNCIFPIGTAGVLQGLSDEQLCGEMCGIIDVDLVAKRYVVHCGNGRQLKVRFEKVIC